MCHFIINRYFFLPTNVGNVERSWKSSDSRTSPSTSYSFIQRYRTGHVLSNGRLTGTISWVLHWSVFSVSVLTWEITSPFLCSSNVRTRPWDTVTWNSVQVTWRLSVWREGRRLYPEVLSRHEGLMSMTTRRPPFTTNRKNFCSWWDDRYGLYIVNTVFCKSMERRIYLVYEFLYDTTHCKVRVFFFF